MPKKMRKKKKRNKRKGEENKAGYTAQDAPSTGLKITGDGPTDGRTDRWTHPLIEMRERI